jgi:glyoxylase I family protein
VSLAFYNGLLGLPVNPERPHDKLPYDGAWLMMGTEMVHLMVRRCRLYR